MNVCLLSSSCWRNPTKSLCNAEYMSIYWKVVLLKIEHQDTCHSLGPNPFELRELPLHLIDGQIPQVLKANRAPLLPHAPQHRPDPRRLRRRQAPTPDGVLQPHPLLVHHLVPGGEGGLEGGECAAGDGVRGVLREEGGDEPVEDGRTRGRLVALVLRREAEAEEAEGRELVREAVEGEEGVADGQALRGGGGGVAMVGLQRRVAPRRRGRQLPPGLPGHLVGCVLEAAVAGDAGGGEGQVGRAWAGFGLELMWT